MGALPVATLDYRLNPGLQLIPHASIYEVGRWSFVIEINGLRPLHSLTCAFIVPPIKERDRRFPLIWVWSYDSA